MIKHYVGEAVLWPVGTQYWNHEYRNHEYTIPFHKEDGMDFTQKSRMRSVWIKLWWFEREIHSFSFKIILNFKKVPLTYLASKHCCLVHHLSGDLLKKQKKKALDLYNMFYAKYCFIEKWVYSNTPELFVQEFMNDVTPQIFTNTTSQIHWSIPHTFHGKTLW